MVSAERVLPVAPAVIFELLCDPGRHRDLDGSGTLQGSPAGPVRLQLGSEFTMAMRQSRLRYRSTSRVVEFDEGTLITWASMGVWRGRRIVGGQRWRWRLTPVDNGTRVEHSYVWGYAVLPLLTVRLPGYPRRAVATLPRSLARLEVAVGPERS